MDTCNIMPAEEFEKLFPEIHQQVCEELGMGFVPLIFRMVAGLNPAIALSSWNMVRYNLCSGSMPRITKELMFSYVAHKKNCEYCLTAHHAMAIKHGFSDEEMKTILDDPDNIRNRSLRLLIKFTDASLTNDNERIAICREELVDAGFDSNEIAEVVGMVSCALYMVNIADSLGVEADKGFYDVIAQNGKVAWES